MRISDWSSDVCSSDLHSSGVPIAPNGSRAHCKEAIMAQIGSFTRADNGIYTGEIRTLTLRVKATIRPVEREHDKEPDHRVNAGGVEFGAAWTRSEEHTSELQSLMRISYAVF